jgi:hypothetical protein
MSRHLAQLNIGRLRHDVGDPRMAEFVDNLALVNGLAERSPGFVWRYRDDSGSAIDTRPFDGDPRMAINLSVWDSVEALERFVWQTVLNASMAIAINGSSAWTSVTSSCGGCRRDISRRCRRRSSGCATSSSVDQATMRLAGRAFPLQSCGKQRVAHE